MLLQETLLLKLLTYDQYTNKVRAQKFVTMRGRLFLVGIECDCMANQRPK
jgi:hypothetical protein